MIDALGDRIKHQYEWRTRSFLPRRTYTIIRVDGKAFHTLTRGAQRPFDAGFMAAMDATMLAMAADLQGCNLAYTQSDEISFLLTDFATIQTEAFFDGNVQKITSVAASLATWHFSRSAWTGRGPALFDARVFTIPDRTEVANYFLWRQRDAVRNSVAMAAQARFSPGALHGAGVAAMQDLLHTEGVNWDAYPVRAKRGAQAVYHTYVTAELERHAWQAQDPPIYTVDSLDAYIPYYP